MCRSWTGMGLLCALLLMVCTAPGVAAQTAAESIVKPRSFKGRQVPSERDEQESLFNKGTEAWNNPIYAYKVDVLEDGEHDGVHFKNVRTTVTYTAYGSDDVRRTDEETGQRHNNRSQEMTYRYTLALDDEGRIIGGAARSNSGHFLWLPLYAVQGQADGSAPGNPYVDVEKVIALARASAIPDAQKRFDEAVLGPAQEPSSSAESAPAEADAP